MKDLYFLLDSRAGTLSAYNDGRNVSELDEDCDRYVLLADTAIAVCREANAGNYGDHCVVSDTDWNIKWEWFNGAEWNKPEPLPSKVFGRYE